MAINKKLIHFDTLSSFQGANGINTSSMASMDESTFNGATRNVPFRSIVFIKDRNLIWTHGTYYKGTDTTYDSKIKEGIIRLPDRRDTSDDVWLEPWYRVATIKSTTDCRNSILLFISSCAPSSQDDVCNALLSVRVYNYSTSSNGYTVKLCKIYGSWPNENIKLYYKATSSSGEKPDWELWVRRNTKYDGTITTKVLAEHTRAITNRDNVITLDERLNFPTEGDVNSNCYNSVSNPTTMYSTGDSIEATDLFASLATNSTNAISMLIGEMTRSISASALKTSLGLSGNYLTEHQTLEQLNTKLASYDDGQIRGIRGSILGGSTNVRTDANLNITDLYEGAYFINYISGGTHYPTTTGSALRMYRIPKNSGSSIVQSVWEFFAPHASNTVYFRNSWGTGSNKSVVTTWNDWYEILHTGNYTSFLNGNYLPLAGGTMTGTINVRNSDSNSIDLGSTSGRWRTIYLQGGISYKMDRDTSNCKDPLYIVDSSNTQIGEIAYHNTAEENSGAFIITPYPHSGTNSWNKGIGLYISKSYLKWEGKDIIVGNLGSTLTGKNYPLLKDGSNNLYVNVPWENDNTDTKVTLSNTETTKFISVLLGKTQYDTVNENVGDPVTDTSYIDNILRYLPSSGTLYARHFYKENSKKILLADGTADYIIKNTNNDYVIHNGNNSDSEVPTSLVVYNAINEAFSANNALIFKGTCTATASSGSINTNNLANYGNVNSRLGWLWIVSVNNNVNGGAYGYFGSEKVEPGDLVISGDDNPGTTQSKYYIILKNIDPSIYVTLTTELTITGQKTFNSTNTIFNKNVLLNGQTDIASAQVGNLQVSGLINFTQVAYGCTPDSIAENNELVTAEWIKNKILNIGTVTVSGEKTIWGATYVNSNKVLLNVEGSLTIPNGQYLYTGSISTTGKGIVFYEGNSNFFGAWGEFSSSLNIPTYIRSTGSDNLYHRYRNSSGTTLDKIIIDENNLGGSFTESKRYPIKFDTTSKKLYVDVSWTDNNSATATDAILDGSNDGTAIKYEPYSADTAILSWVNNNSNAGKLYFGELNPSKTTRLNYNGYFYASKLYSNGYETITTNTISNYTSDYLTKPSADKKVWGQTYIGSDGVFKDVTGDITLVASGTSNTPRIVYQRGTDADANYDFYAGVNYDSTPYYTIGATRVSSGVQLNPIYLQLTTTVGTAYLGEGINKILTSSNSSVSMDDANTSMTVKINDISKILRLGWYAVSPSVTITESGVEKTYDMFYLSSGWYRILNIKTYPASFILTFYNVYNTYEPAGISFLISCGYTHATITQLNERCAVNYPTILKLRVIQNGNGKFYIDFYYNNVSYSVSTPTKGNRLRYHVTPLDTLIRDSSKIELIDFTTLSNDLTSLVEYTVTLYPFGNTYSTTDTKNTAGITNSTDKLYLIGTKTLTGDYAQTYSNSDVYVTSGVLNLKASQYADTKDTGSLDLHNSDIYGVNSIKFSDKSNNAAEGLQWYRDATHIDSFWISDGVIYFTPNREWGTTGTSYTVLHTNNAKWANLSVSTSLIYNTEPEFGSVTIGNGTSSLTATKKCKLIYDDTNQCLKFIFV